MAEVNVEMTSSGSYYYRYNGLYYNIPSAQFLLKQSYLPERGIKNEVYQTVENNEPLFSPFTSWQIKLRNNENTALNLEEKLKDYLKDVQLVFYGKGAFVDTTTEKNRQTAFRVVRLDESFKPFETDLSEVPLGGGL